MYERSHVGTHAAIEWIKIDSNQKSIQRIPNAHKPIINNLRCCAQFRCNYTYILCLASQLYGEPTCLYWSQRRHTITLHRKLFRTWISAIKSITNCHDFDHNLMKEQKKTALQRVLVHLHVHVQYVKLIICNRDEFTRACNCKPNRTSMRIVGFLLSLSHETTRLALPKLSSQRFDKKMVNANI